MDDVKDCKNETEKVVDVVCDFLGMENPHLNNGTIKETIKELCVIRLCKTIGLTCKFNYKSMFFEFFSSIMGEAVCDKLGLKIHIAGDNLRLFKYEHINLVQATRSFLDYENIEESFLDAFDLADKYKYLIPQIC